MSLILEDNYQYRSIINDIDNLLNNIVNIFNNYKLDLRREEEIVRLEKFHKYDPKLINKTFTNPRLFTNDNKSIFPKELYSYVYEDNIDIYENKFVVSLLDDIARDLMKTLSNQNCELRFLESGISYGEYGTNQLIDKYSNNDMTSKLITFESDLINKISILRNNDFYKRVSKISLSNIEVTNLLLDDEDYNACYRFYKKRMENSEEYKNNIKLKIKNLLKNDDKLNKNKDLFVYSKNDFIYSIYFKNRIHVSVKNIINNDEVRYRIDFRMGLFDNYAILSFDNEKVNILIKDENDVLELIDSFTLRFKFNNDLCPICKHSMYFNNCLHCNASYKNINDQYLWLYNVFMVREEN